MQARALYAKLFSIFVSATDLTPKEVSVCLLHLTIWHLPKITMMSPIHYEQTASAKLKARKFKMYLRYYWQL
jgi:hypothetical protein